MDNADRTAERDEAEAPARIAASKKPEGPAATGACLFCDEPVADGDRWCNIYCREDWEKEQWTRRQLA